VCISGIYYCTESVIHSFIAVSFLLQLQLVYVCECVLLLVVVVSFFFCLVGKNREHNKFVTEYNTKTGAEESKNYK